MALAEADRFLQAWQSQNQEDGLLMLSDVAKRRLAEDQVQAFFAVGDDAAYQIGRGKKLHGARFAFPVALFGSTRTGSVRYSKIVVVRLEKQGWAIEKLP